MFEAFEAMAGSDDAAVEASPQDVLGEDPESETSGNRVEAESQESNTKDDQAADGPVSETSSDEESVESHGTLSAVTLIMGEEGTPKASQQPSSQASSDAGDSQDAHPDSQVSTSWMGKAINHFTRQEEAQKKAQTVDKLVKAGLKPL